MSKDFLFIKNVKRKIELMKRVYLMFKGYSRICI